MTATVSFAGVRTKGQQSCRGCAWTLITKCPGGDASQGELVAFMFHGVMADGFSVDPCIDTRFAEHFNVAQHLPGASSHAPKHQTMHCMTLAVGVYS